MDTIILALSYLLSCFILVHIFFQFMDERYTRTYENKWIYRFSGIGSTILMTAINLLEIKILNFTVWLVLIAVSVAILYYENNSKIKRIVECEMFFLALVIVEAMGTITVYWLLRMMHSQINNSVMENCLEIAFSKVLIILWYYLFVKYFSKKSPVADSKIYYVSFLVIAVYSVANLLVIIKGLSYRNDNAVFAVNMGCIVVASLYFLNILRSMEEKKNHDETVKILEQQAKLQYEYYVQQEQKYNQTIQILHDVNKHIMSIENLYANGENDTATEYVKEINNMLKPLTPIRYTGNPILDILLTDKVTVGKEKGIRFDISVDNADLNFLDAIDITTIFGNLIDNAIEASEKLNGDKFIRIRLSSYQDMIILKMENGSLTVKMKNGVPVSDKGKKHGIGLLNVKRSIEKYDGNITFKQQNNIFTVDLLLNY